MPPGSSRHVRPSAPAPSCQADLTTGALVRGAGDRCAALTIDFVQRLHFTLVEQFGEAAQDLLYRTGFEWGLQEMLSLSQERPDRSDGDASTFWQRDAGFVFDTWWQPMRDAGWGNAVFDFSRLTRGIVVVEVQHSIVAEALAGTDQPVCHWYAGFFAGGVSFFARTERHATEIQCQALGHPACRFVVGPGPEVDAAETGRQQGLTAAEIVRRLG